MREKESKLRMELNLMRSGQESLKQVPCSDPLPLSPPVLLLALRLLHVFRFFLHLLPIFPHPRPVLLLPSLLSSRSSWGCGAAGGKQAAISFLPSTPPRTVLSGWS
eukprot:760835-Hanusia_phi.AAC.5